MADTKITSKRLKQAMNENRLTAQELANKAGIGKASISQYVNGSHAPSNLSAGKLANVLGVDPMWLMGFDVPKNSNTATYYMDDDAARAAQSAFDDHKVLFDACRKVKSEDIDKVLKIIRAFTD